MDVNSMMMSVITDRHLGNPIIFTLDDGQHLIDGLDGNVVILDQKNELAHSIRYTLGQYSKSHNEFEIISFPYGKICSISSNLSKNDVESFLNKLKQDEVILDDIEIERIKNSLLINKKL